MSPSIFILPVMNAIVGFRSPAISASRSSMASLIVQSAGPSVVEIVAPSMTMTPSDPVSNFTERSKPGALDLRLHLIGDVLNAHVVLLRFPDGGHAVRLRAMARRRLPIASG